MIEELVATKALTAGLAKECWDDLMQDVIASASDFGETWGHGEDDGRRNNQDNVFIDVKYGYNDDEADPMMTTAAAGRDDSDDENE